MAGYCTEYIHFDHVCSRRLLMCSASSVEEAHKSFVWVCHSVFVQLHQTQQHPCWMHFDASRCIDELALVAARRWRHYR